MNIRVFILKIAEAMNVAIIGQETVVERLLITFLANGHVLKEGRPGEDMTRSFKDMGNVVDSLCRRVQFTRDLLPSDVTGSEIYRGLTEIRLGTAFSGAAYPAAGGAGVWVARLHHRAVGCSLGTQIQTTHQRWPIRQSK